MPLKEREYPITTAQQQHLSSSKSHHSSSSRTVSPPAGGKKGKARVRRRLLTVQLKRAPTLHIETRTTQLSTSKLSEMKVGGVERKHEAPSDHDYAREAPSPRIRSRLLLYVRVYSNTCPAR